MTMAWKELLPRWQWRDHQSRPVGSPVYQWDPIVWLWPGVDHPTMVAA